MGGYPPQGYGDKATLAAKEVWEYSARVLTELSETKDAAWLKTYGTTEHDLVEVSASVREVVIHTKEMGDVEPVSQVLIFRLYRYRDGAWDIDDSVDVVPSEKDVMTISDVHGHMKVTLQPSLETQQDYNLPYTLYYQ